MGGFIRLLAKIRNTNISHFFVGDTDIVRSFEKMPRNVEIKAFVTCMSSLRSKAAELSKSDGVEIKQSDTFFTTNQGRLKLRHLIGTDAQLVYYDRSDKEGPKLSDYHIVTTDQPEELSKVLSKALGVRGEVKKTRWLYMVGQTRVHCDTVEGLGDFAELEVVLEDNQSVEDGQLIADDLMEKLGIEKTKLIKCAYMDLLDAQNKDQ